VVLIDHGLSVPLPPSFRLKYLELWQCLFSHDIEGLKAICKDWGIDIGADPMAAHIMGSAILLQGWSSLSRQPKHSVVQRGSHGMKLRENGHTQSTEAETLSKERQKEQLEAQRAMKATVRRLLEKYERIPKVYLLLLLQGRADHEQELIFLGRSMRIIQANNQVRSFQPLSYGTNGCRLWVVQ